MKKFLFLIAITLFVVTNTQASELIFGWNLVNPSGRIYDMQFMPDNDYFVLCTATDIQIRSSETGELTKTFPLQETYSDHYLEFTPDSTNLIISYGRNLEKRSVIDMSIIDSYIVPLDSEGFDIALREIVVDPVRPYIYALKYRFKHADKFYHYAKIEIYNYETMEFIGELTSEKDEELFLQNLAISKDGKYLAVMTELESYIKVWDLETRVEIRTFKLCNDYENGPTGYPTCLKFSEINTDNIYFSGSFPQSNSGLTSHDGLFKYNIQSNKIVDSTFGVVPNQLYFGYFNFFDNENKILYVGNGKNVVLNLLPPQIEFMREIGFDGAGSWSKILYSNKKKYLLGFSNKKFSLATYDTLGKVEKHLEKIQTIYPNPTNGIINIAIECQSVNQTYTVSDINGSIILPFQQISEGQSSLIIDFSIFPSGVYFIKLHCGKDIKTYKVIKEG